MRQKKTKTMYNDIKINAEQFQSSYLDYNQNFLESFFNDHLQFKSNTFANLKTDRQKWNFINEARNLQRCKTSITSLKNSFCDVIANQTSIANLTCLITNSLNWDIIWEVFQITLKYSSLLPRQVSNFNP